MGGKLYKINGTFKPNNEITRSEYAKITAVSCGYTASNSDGEIPFSDLDPEFWAYEYIVACAENGVLNGYPDGTFGCDKNITNAENIVIAKRTHENLTKSMMAEPVEQETKATADKTKSSGSGAGGGGVPSASPIDYSETENQTAQPLEENGLEIFQDGDGSQSNPFKITSVEQLTQLSQIVQNGTNLQGIYFDLTQDIYLNDVTNIDNWGIATPSYEWTPIGLTKEQGFDGHFDGNGHSINGLYINRPSDANGYNVGLFGVISADSTVSNLTVNGFVRGFENVGIIAGYSVGKIENCKVFANIDGKNNIGGIVGFIAALAYVTDCQSYGTIHGEKGVGGIVGSNDGGNFGSGDIGGYVANCKNHATVSSTDIAAGGIVGDNNGYVINCVNDATISSEKNYVGGIVGYNLARSFTNSTILNCENSGDIFGVSQIGGICGSTAYIVANCLNKGNIFYSGTSNKYVGYICGQCEILTCYIVNCVNVKSSANIINIAGYYNSMFPPKGGNIFCISDTGTEKYNIKTCKSVNSNYELYQEITVNDVTTSSLLTALNTYAKSKENEGYCQWTIDQSTGELELDFSSNNISGVNGIEKIIALDNSKKNWLSVLFDPIDLSTGAQIINLSFLNQNSAIGLGINLEYNSLLNTEGALGSFWTFNYETKLDLSNIETPVIIWAANRRNTFNKQSDSTFGYKDNYGSKYVLKTTGEGYTLETPQKLNYSFDNTGKLLKQIDKYGNFLSFEYQDDKLVKIIDNLTKKYIEIAYTGDLVSSFEGSNGTQVQLTYSNGIISEITDEAGNVRQYTYNEDNKVLTGLLNGQLIFSNSYDDFGRIIAQDDGIDGNLVSTLSYNESDEKLITMITDRNGNSQIREHNANYQLIKATDSLGATVSYQYDQNGNTTEIVDSLGRKISYKYDDKGNLIEITDAKNNKTVMEYDQNDNITKVISAEGAVTQYIYSERGNLLSTTDEEGNVTTYTYNENGLPTSSTMPNGATSAIEYNSDGTVNFTTDAAGVRAYYTYDSNGRIATKSDKNGNSITYEYDAKGNVIKITDPFGDSILSQYDANGNLIQSTDPNGNISYYEYDKNNNLVKSTDVLGNVMTYQYDGEGRLVGYTDKNGNFTSMTLDAVGNVLSVTDAMDNTIRYKYDDAYRVSAVYDALGVKVARYEYDIYDNVTKITDALGRSVTYEYDKFGKIISESDPLDNKTFYDYDIKGRLIEVTDPIGGVSSVSYNNMGRVTSISDDDGITASYSYDIANRLVAQSTVNGNNITYAYNNLSRVSSITNGRGQQTDFAYDEAGQLTTINAPDGNNIAYEYDNIGNLVTISDKIGDITRTYDELGRVASCTDTENNTLSYNYDPNGNLTYIIYHDGKIVNYEYNALNQLVKVTDWNNKSTVYAYDANGRLISTTRPNGTKLENTYDAVGQLVDQIDYNLQTREIIYRAIFTYDDAGRIIEEDTTAEMAVPFAEQIAMSYSAGNVLLTINEQSVTTDEDGNITNLPLVSGDMNLEYDYNNRLTGTDDCEYTYNSENSRIAVNYRGQITKYVVNQNSSISQTLVRTKANGEMAYYVYGLGLIAQYENDEYKTYHFDCRGSTVVITDKVGTVTDTFGYDTYGALVGRTGSTDTPFGYCGQYGVMSDANGLIYMRARYYTPEIGRFLSQDTVVGSITDSTSLNRFAYCGGNPVSYVDPQGRFAEAAVGAIGAIYGLYGNLPTSTKLIIGTVGTGIGIAIMAATGVGAAAIAGAVLTSVVVPTVIGGCVNLGISSSVAIVQMLAGTRTDEYALSEAGRALLGGAIESFGLAGAMFGIGNGISAVRKLGANRGGSEADFGKKMEYVFGNATGNKHNIDRSVAMQKQLNSIGIFDNKAGRKLVQDNLTKALNDPSSILKVQENGRIVRESLLAGPNGIVKVESIWENAKLLTVQIFGGK